MQGEFEMSMMGELSFFLGLQVKKLKDDIFLSQRCKLDRNSTSGTCHILKARLIYWHRNKQVCVALSTAKVEYIVVGSCCAKILWIKQ